jgi:hypothetical protein
MTQEAAIRPTKLLKHQHEIHNQEPAELPVWRQEP